jgi:hypothetical protein
MFIEGQVTYQIKMTGADGEGNIITRSLPMHFTWDIPVIHIEFRAVPEGEGGTIKPYLKIDHVLLEQSSE